MDLPSNYVVAVRDRDGEYARKKPPSLKEKEAETVQSASYLSDNI